MGNKHSRTKTNKNSANLPCKNPSFINVNCSFSQSSQTMITPKSTAHQKSFTPISTLHPLSLPNIPQSIHIASRTSFSTRHKLSIVCTKPEQQLNINNGVTGKYLSCRIAKIASDFWKENVQTLSVDDKLEIGSAIFFAMLSTNKEMKKIMLVKNTNLKSTSIKYLEMMGWLMQNLLRNDIDLYLLLTRLGTMHQSMGINIKHFNPMLEAIHEVFPYYFPNQYNIQVKYAIDEIFTIAAQIMSGQDVKCCSYLNDIVTSFNTTGNDIAFLKNLNICLKSSVGKKYLYSYLRQTWCEELAIFLQSLHRFKNQTSTKERFMVARSIHKTSILPLSNVAINISYECRENILFEMDKLEQRFVAKQELCISSDFFNQCEIECKKLIRENHWTKFVNNIEQLQLDSLE